MKNRYENRLNVTFWIIMGLIWLIGLVLSVWYLITFSYGLGG